MSKTLPEFSREVIRRLTEANRAAFDSTSVPPSAAQCRIDDLEEDQCRIYDLEEEVTELRRQLHGFETSTIWRFTWPLRWAVERLRHRPAPPLIADTVPVSTFPRILSYTDWTVSEEANCHIALAEPGPGKQAIEAQRLGLVLIVGHGGGSALTELVRNCPTTCTILVLGEDATLRCCPDAGQIISVPLPPGFSPADAASLALEHLDSDMLCFLDARDQLAPDALFLVAENLARQPQLDLIFADEDWLNSDGERVRPFFKPGWDTELQRGRDLLGPFTFFRTALVRATAPPSGPAWLYDLANQVAAMTRPERICHIPAVLCHRTVMPLGYTQAMGAAVARQFRRDGLAARTELVSENTGWQRVIYDVPEPAPMVSVIVPTRDHVELLRACAEGVLNHTSYPRLELLIVDNGTVEPDAVALLEKLEADSRVQVLRQPGTFNWSALNNAAVARATGDVLVLLNNDIVVLQGDWLTVLVSHAIQKDVGAVGPKLLYPDGRVQHAGLTTGPSGIPRHLFRYAAGDDAGAFGLMGLAREVWGVTGACLAIRRDIFLEIGGLNEAFAVTYNDVEFCLRLTARGYRILWTPWSVVEHREMATRPPDHLGSRRVQAREELRRLQRDWGYLVLHDPFLNPNLEIVDEQLCFGNFQAHGGDLERR